MPKDIIRISQIPGLEPEEQPITREADIQIPLRGSLTGESLGVINSQFEETQSAHEFTEGLKRTCINCKHFDNVRAQQLFIESSRTADGQRELNNLKANLLQMDLGSDDDDLDSGMTQLGLCRAITEIDKKDTIVHPLGTCPVETYGDNFKAIDRAAERRVEKLRDSILLGGDS
jgi:hypothetical protein